MELDRKGSWAWQLKPAIPVPRRERQEDFEFEVSLDYIAKFCGSGSSKA